MYAYSQLNALTLDQNGLENLYVCACVHSYDILTMADLGELILPLYEKESICDK